MLRAASALLLVAVTLYSAVPTFAQQASTPATVTPTRQAFQTLTLGMTRERVSKVVGSQGPMDLKQEVWGRWVPGTTPGRMEILRVHFFDNQVYWVEYDTFGDTWVREEKGSCNEWVRGPAKRLQDSLKLK